MPEVASRRGYRLDRMKPFANEPILELRRASVRAGLADALTKHDAKGPLKVPVWIGDDKREGWDITSTDPGKPDRVVAEAASARPGDVDHALATARPWNVPAQQRAGHAAARRAVDPRAAAGDRGARGARVREAVAGGGRRRLRGDRLPRVLRARGARPRARRSPAPAARRAQRAALGRPRDRRRDLSVELPGGDRARDDRRRPRHRQRGDPQAGRAVARLRARHRRRRSESRACRRARSPCCPARAMSAPRWSATRACTRSPSPAPTRSGSTSCALPPRRRRARSTSSA